MSAGRRRPALFGLSLAQVYAALTYYHLNKPEIDAQIKRDEEKAEQLLAELERQGKLTHA